MNEKTQIDTEIDRYTKIFHFLKFYAVLFFKFSTNSGDWNFVKDHQEKNVLSSMLSGEMNPVFQLKLMSGIDIEKRRNSNISFFFIIFGQFLSNYQPT